MTWPDYISPQTVWMLLGEERQNDPATYPAQELLAKLEAGMPIDAAGQQRRDELWKKIWG